jgi:hypothetical protein
MKRIEFSVDCRDHEADRIQVEIESFLKTSELQYRLNGVTDIAISRSTD